MTFTRVNNGVAFATYEIFTSADANALRTNDDLFWAAHIRSLDSAAVEMADIDAAMTRAFGAPQWSAHYGAYLAMAPPPNSSATTGWLASMPPGGPIALKAETFVTGFAATPTAPPQIMTLKENLYDRAVIAYEYTGTNKTALAVSAAAASWTHISQYDFTRVQHHPSGVYVDSNGREAIIGGHWGSQAALLLVALNAGTVSGTKFEGTLNGTTVGSLVSDGSGLVLASTTNTNALNGLLYTSSTGLMTEPSMPVHASANPAERRVAYDPASGRFVYMMVGALADPDANGCLMWTSTANPSSWSATVGWKRVSLGDQNFVTAPFSLSDFTITADGVWLVVVRDNRALSLSKTFRLFASLDSGSTWNGYGSWVRDSASGPLRLSKSGPSFAAVQSATAGTDTSCVLLVSSATPTTTSPLNTVTL